MGKSKKLEQRKESLHLACRNWTAPKSVIDTFTEDQLALVKAMSATLWGVAVGCMESALLLREFLKDMRDMLEFWVVTPYEQDLVLMDSAEEAVKEWEQAKVHHLNCRKALRRLTYRLRDNGADEAFLSADSRITELRRMSRESKIEELKARIEALKACGLKTVAVRGVGVMYRTKGWSKAAKKLQGFVRVRVFLDSLGSSPGQLTLTKNALREGDPETVCAPLPVEGWSRDRLSYFELKAMKQRAQGQPFDAGRDVQSFDGDTMQEKNAPMHGVCGEAMNSILIDAAHVRVPQRGKEHLLIDFTQVESWTNKLAKPIMSNGKYRYEALTHVLIRDVRKGSDTYMTATSGSQADDSQVDPGKNWPAEVAYVGNHPGDPRPNKAREGSFDRSSQWATIVSKRITDPWDMLEHVLKAVYETIWDRHIGQDPEFDFRKMFGIYGKYGYHICGVSQRIWFSSDQYGDGYYRVVLKKQVSNLRVFNEAWLIFVAKQFGEHVNVEGCPILAFKVGPAATRTLWEELYRGYLERAHVLAYRSGSSPVWGQFLEPANPTNTVSQNWAKVPMIASGPKPEPEVVIPGKTYEVKPKGWRLPCPEIPRWIAWRNITYRSMVRDRRALALQFVTAPFAV